MPLMQEASPRCLSRPTKLCLSILRELSNGKNMPLKKARFRISDFSKGRKRRVKEHERRVRVVSLSLTSMVDMFAVLVVYLIINSTSVQEWVQMATGIDLPKAKANWETPERGATLQVTDSMVLGDIDHPLISIDEVSRGPYSVPKIKTYLKSLEKKNKYVNIVGDYKVPFGAMRRIIASCQDAGFENVNLAIEPAH